MSGERSRSSFEDYVDQTLPVIQHMVAEGRKGITEGQMPCPRCGGVVKWVRLGPRSARAKCETPQCLELLS